MTEVRQKKVCKRQLVRARYQGNRVSCPKRQSTTFPDVLGESYERGMEDYYR
jgi:hypothetical protein